MDPELIKYHEKELKYIRSMAAVEFARDFPKIAARLGLNELRPDSPCDDPYVERLLEGFAFLAARVKLKVDAEFPRFTQHLLEMIYPHFLAPLPSMTVVQIQPDLDDASLSEKCVIPRHSEELLSLTGKGEQTKCIYRTAHDVILWPIKLSEAEYLADASAVGSLDVPIPGNCKAGLRIKLETTAGIKFSDLELDRLPIFLHGETVAYKLYEHFVANLLDVVARPAQGPSPWEEHIPVSGIRGMGFDEDHALLPYTARSFQGYRLLQEYFAMPQRFLFIELAGLKKTVRRCDTNELELIFMFDRVEMELSRVVKPDHLKLHCTPAINLFPKRADRITLTHKTTEHQIVPDRHKPMDYEIYDVSGVDGYGADADSIMEFLPFYKIKDEQILREKRAYYTLYREMRRLSTKQRLTQPRSSYVGSEVFISLVDADESPYGKELKQIGLKCLCTNRDLPLHMPVAPKEKTDFSLTSGLPVKKIKCLVGPTSPKPTIARQSTTWKLISHLSLNYLSLTDNDKEEGSAALRQILSLYGEISKPEVQKQIDGIRYIKTESVIRRIDIPNPAPGQVNFSFGRGLKVEVEFDDSAFQGSGAILLGAVLERFFARYTSINSFTQTVIKTLNRGVIKEWPIRTGRRQTL